MQTSASINTIATLPSGWSDFTAFSEAPPQALQDSNPFHFEDSQVVLQVSHIIVSHVPI